MRGKIGLVLLTILLGGWLLFACDVPEAEPTEVPPVVQLMPELAGYDVVEGQALQEYVASLAEGGTLLAGHPELTGLIIKADDVIDCYQEVGAARLQVYSDEDFPLSSGAIAIVDRDRLLDPATLFQCVGGGIVPFSAEPTLDPCAHSYTLQREDGEFYVTYVGTTQEICQAFCQNLEGCSTR